MSTTTDKPTVEEIRQRHQVMMFAFKHSTTPPAVMDIGVLLAEIDSLKAAVKDVIRLIHSDDSEGGDYHRGMAILCEIAGYKFPANEALKDVRPITIYEAMKK